MSVRTKKRERPADDLQAEEKQKLTIFAKGKMDLGFLLLIFVLLITGLVMLFSASYAYAFYYMDNSLHFISRQLAFAVIGVAAMLFISRIDYHVLRRLVWPLYVVTIGLLIIVLFMEPLNGARRWIYLGFTTFQPSEIAKLTIVVVFSHLACKYYTRMKTLQYGVIPFAVFLLPIAGLMVLQPHLSGLILICILGAIIMVAGGTRLKYFFIAAGIAIALIAVLILIPGVIEYASSRIEHWINPYSDMQGAGFQTIQSLYAIGSGGLFGVGLGNSRQKYLYLPEPHNDFIFAIVCEELGFVGAAIIIIVFALLFYRGFTIAMRAKDRFGCLLALGLTSQVAVQTILNIMVVTKMLPNTGISLPFFSYGGTALLMLLAQMGVILSVSRTGSVKKD